MCYVWCLNENVLFVFDPRYGVPVPETRLHTHERLCYMLKTAMHSLIASTLRGWKHDWTSAKMRVISWSHCGLAGLVP